jgi:hypothetical protein
LVEFTLSFITEKKRDLDGSQYDGLQYKFAVGLLASGGILEGSGENSAR